MNNGKNPVQSADKILKILETLSITGPIGVVELSNMMGFHKSTTFRLLSSLQYMGYVKQDKDSSKYQLTFKVLEIAGRLLNKMDIVSIAHPHIKKLVEICGETVHLVQRSGNDIVYIDKVESDTNSIRMVSNIGTTMPMYCSGVGKAIMATLSREEVENIWNKSRIENITPNTITKLEELYEVLDEVNEKGYALDNEENELGVRCIAGAIVDYKGEARNAFSISAPASRMTDSRIRELSKYILEVKETISKELGYLP